MNQNELQNTVLCGDALEVLKTLPDECVQMCVTSPPYTVEGNSGDSCRVNQYSVGHYEVLGYGVPQY